MTAATAEPGTEPSRNPRLTGTLLPANWRVNLNPAGERWSGRSDGIERSLDPGYASTCLPAGRIGGGEVACLPRSLSAPACRHATADRCNAQAGGRQVRPAYRPLSACGHAQAGEAGHRQAQSRRSPSSCPRSADK